MNFISYEDFKKTDEYKNFIKENPSVGKIKILAFTAYGAVPIENAEILITKKVGNKEILFYRGFTNSSGVISNIDLPAPIYVEKPEFDDIPKYTMYDLTAIHEGYETIKKYRVGMFGNVKIIQYVKMTPKIALEGVEENGN